MAIRNTKQAQRVLAVEPYYRGFAYAVLEGPDRLIEWAVKETRAEKKHHHILRQISALLKLYTPDIFVIEDLVHNRRTSKTVDLMAGIVDLVRGENYTVATISRAQMQLTFSVDGNATKGTISPAIIARFPELADWLPPIRKIWKSEDSKLHIFTAVANALAYYRPAQVGD